LRPERPPSYRWPDLSLRYPYRYADSSIRLSLQSPKTRSACSGQIPPTQHGALAPVPLRQPKRHLRLKHQPNSVSFLTSIDPNKSAISVERLLIACRAKSRDRKDRLLEIRDWKSDLQSRISNFEFPIIPAYFCPGIGVFPSSTNTINFGVAAGGNGGGPAPRCAA